MRRVERIDLFPLLPLLETSRRTLILVACHPEEQMNLHWSLHKTIDRSSVLPTNIQGLMMKEEVSGLLHVPA